MDECKPLPPQPPPPLPVLLLVLPQLLRTLLPLIRGVQSFPFQLNLSSSVHQIIQLDS